MRLAAIRPLHTFRMPNMLRSFARGFFPRLGAGALRFAGRLARIISAAAPVDRSFRRVKMLCSFGGGFFPRPGDGALRYAGGHTRIISMGRRTSFPELYRQMADVYGGPVAIRYQIPEGELDLLISVSSSEDLHNMMEECEKLADASAMLRIFLFSPSKIASAATEFYTSRLVDTYDREKTYIKAINAPVTGAAEAGSGSEKHQDIVIDSASSSAQKSDIPDEQVYCDGWSLMENREYRSQPSMSSFVHELCYFYLEPMDGMMEAPPSRDFENMMSSEKFNPTATTLTISKDSKTEILTFGAVGEQIHENKMSQDAASLFEATHPICFNGGIIKDTNSQFDQRNSMMQHNSLYQNSQDIEELVKQVAESVLKSLTPISNETVPACPYSAHMRDDMTSSSSIDVQEGLEDMIKLDRTHFGVPLADYIEHLQIIKSEDIEELEILGAGTFGTVFHGKWRGSEVAIKRTRDKGFIEKPLEQKQMRVDFWNEASRLASLHHPNILTFYGAVLDSLDGSFAIVTEYMINGSLRNALQHNLRFFNRHKCLLLAMDAAFGMEYLHEKNIIHFDLKSDNLLINVSNPKRPICKVGDLGLSKGKYKNLISGGGRGTIPWMAPELLNGRHNLVSEKVDVYSFGIVMWELLTGEEPYADLDSEEIIGGIVGNTLRPPVPNYCDSGWKALMEQCWSAEPSARPSFTHISRYLRFMEAGIS